jgi:hypothetical protein
MLYSGDERGVNCGDPLGRDQTLTWWKARVNSVEEALW